MSSPSPAPNFPQHYPFMPSDFGTAQGAHIAGGSHTKPEDTFATLWAEAVRKFQQSADISSTLWNSLSDTLLRCKSCEDVLNAFENTTRKWKEFNAADTKWKNVRIKYLQPVVQALLLFNDAIAELASHFPTIPGGKAIFVAFGVLLQATSEISERCEVLIDLLEELNSFLERLAIRLVAPSALGPVSKALVIVILAHLLDVFLTATKLISQPLWRTRLVLYKQALTKDKGMMNALERLRALTELETRAMATETHVTVVSSRATLMEIQSVATQTASEISKMYRELLELTRVEQRHHMNADASRILEKLQRVEAADINAQNHHGCLEDTRVDILKELREWSRDEASPQIFWLNGMAGIGKSAIARSLCHDLRRDGLLGGSFFCSRQRSAEEGDAARILSTLSASLALCDPDYNRELLAELEREPFSRHWNLDIQIERLLHNPFAHVTRSSRSQLVFVIDALDECSNEGTTRSLLLKLVKVARCIPIKFFLTSRPEPHIRQQLEDLDSVLGRVLRLHDIEKDVVEADIRLYLTHGLNDMRKTLRPALRSTWPLEAEITTLTALSGRLFIYAFTALTYIRRNPIERLSKIASGATPVGQVFTRPLDAIYTLILMEAMDPDMYDPDEIDLTQRMIAVIISLYEPLTIDALGELLSMPAYRIRSSLDRLYAVIYVPVRDDSGTLSTFHASLATSSQRKGVPLNPLLKKISGASWQS
ncbi:unnamed protein product [Peniophora sp. CBMAI 1063]|nr:unnamed protein product [Peniophora sp. CBMAI 1063]